MSVQAGIVGLPNVGKSTIFNSLTNAEADSENYPFCTIDPNLGIIPVPDPRLDVIEKYIDTKEVTPATVEILDIAGLVKGAADGEGLGNKFLANIREVDAIIHVVRCFEDNDIAHVEGDIDPERDVDIINTELLLADLETIESRLEKAQRNTKGGDEEAIARVDALEKVKGKLEAGHPARTLDLSDRELELIEDAHLLTMKPVLYIANVAEDDLQGDSEHVEALKDIADREDCEVITLSGEIESELSQLDGEAKEEMLAGLGLEEPALNVLVRATYKLLGLQCFFTAGEQEIRAWTTPVGATAPEAAGEIHSDLQENFVKAEVFRVDELDEHGGVSELREAGKLRLEGKDYVVQDGDVMHIRHGA